MMSLQEAPAPPHPNTTTTNNICNLYCNFNVHNNGNPLQSSSLTILYYNARSLIPKMDELALLADVHNPDVICIVKTWLANDINDAEISISGYHSCQLDRRRHGGGVLLYIKDLYHYTVLPKPNGALEVLSIAVQYNTIPTRVCFYVLSPPSPPAAVLDELCACFESVIETSLNLRTLF